MTEYRKFSQGMGEWELSRAGILRRVRDGFHPAQRKRSVLLGLSEGRHVCVTVAKLVCETWHGKRVADCSFCGDDRFAGKGWRKSTSPKTSELIKWAHERYRGKGTCQ